MKKILGFFVMATLGLASCRNNVATSDDLNETSNEVAFDVKAEVAKMNEALKQYDEPSQFFKVSANKPAKVKGKQGTIISVNPANLETENGKPLGKNIDVELKELTNQQQLLRANAQTVSNGQLLVSGGAYFINMTSDGNQLKLKSGKTLSVEFPKITSEEMYLFYGKRDSLGQMNWGKVDQKFENKPEQVVTNAPVESKPPRLTLEVNDVDAVFDYVDEGNEKPLSKADKKKIENQKKAEEKVYQAIELQQFGWINCDRFYNVPNKTNLYYTFNDSIGIANVYLVFKDINSIMNNCYYSSFEKKSFNDIPIDAKTQLIAVAVKNGKTYTYKSDLTIKANEKIQINLKETTAEDVAKLFQ
ncbi:MAG TPA: hypothetical protein PLP27_02435 [Crocinitomicaceae bacterium]|nr:hypothetical protein [Crocinitomicaceae bacterium]